jgi:hypothetical protein
MEVQWMWKKFVQDNLSDLIGKVDRMNESHGLHNKRSIKRMNKGNEGMQTTKKTTKDRERIEKSHTLEIPRESV